MTGGDAVILAWVVVMVGVVFMFTALHRWRRFAVPQIRREKLVRSANHQSKVIALVDWLQDPKIVRTILEAGVATAQGLQKTVEDIEGMSETEMDATMAYILRDKTVRRVVTIYNEVERGLPRAAVAKALLEWAGPEFTETPQ